MHSYASDSFFRGPRVYLAMGLGSVALAGALPSWLAQQPLLGFINPAALSAGVIYGFCVLAYDLLLWRWLSNIPDLRGTWVGSIDSSHNGGSQLPCVVRIRQTWTRIRVELETSTSSSHTTMAALFQDQSGDRGLKYEFVTEPKGRAVETLQIVRGVCNLGLPDDAQRMSGNYYTGRGRMTEGRINIQRVSGQQLSFEAAQQSKSTP